MVDISILLTLLKVISGNMQQYSKDTFINESGFSLIELLFVIMILAILIPIGAQTYYGYQVKATTDLVNVDLRVIGAAARTFYMNNKKFPDSIPDSIQELVSAGYLAELPKDKFLPGGNIGYHCDKGSNPFKVWSVGPDRNNDGGDPTKDIVLTFAP